MLSPAAYSDQAFQPLNFPFAGESAKPAAISCDWNALRAQLLLQWKRLSSRELDSAGPDRHSLAQLIERKYGVASELVENYLFNFERTMPVAIRQ